MAEVRRTYVDGPFGQVHCRVAAPANARGAPIVCLHMSPKSSRSFSAILPRLAAGRVALAIDNPGHGESDLPPADPPVSIADFARSAWAAADALVGESTPVHFVGHHTGAMVAVEAVRQQPGRVKSIVSLSAPIFTAEELVPLEAMFQPIPIDEDGSRYTLMWARVLENRGPGVTLQMAAASFAENLRAGDHYEWGHRAAFAYAEDYNRRLGEIDTPILLMNPADDCFEVSRRADAIMRNGRRVDLPQWGHGFLDVHTDEAARAMLEFIHEIEGGIDGND